MVKRKKIVVGFDFNGVIARGPFDALLTRRIEEIFWRIGGLGILLRFYNISQALNKEIKALMEDLKKRGIETVIISSQNEKSRNELKRYLRKKGLDFDELYLKSSSESILSFKNKMTSICQIYFDNRKEIVDSINSKHNGCFAYHYNGQTKEELLGLLSSRLAT